MKLLSVNVGRPRTVSFDGRTYATGIDKTAIAGTSLAGGAQSGRRWPRRPQESRRAIPSRLLLPAGTLRLLARATGPRRLRLRSIRRELHYVWVCWRSEVCVGDTLRIGGALIQVTQPRIPCYKLSNKLGIRGFDKTFLRANRSGFYAQVLEEGAVAAGDPIEHISRDPVGMTVADVNAALYLDKQRQAKPKRCAARSMLSHPAGNAII